MSALCNGQPTKDNTSNLSDTDEPMGESNSQSFKPSDSKRADDGASNHSQVDEEMDDDDSWSSESEVSSAVLSEMELDNTEPPLSRLEFLQVKLSEASLLPSGTDAEANFQHQTLIRRIHDLLMVAGEMAWFTAKVRLPDLRLYNERAVQQQQNHLNKVHARLETVRQCLLCYTCGDMVRNGVLNDRQRLVCAKHLEARGLSPPFPLLDAMEYVEELTNAIRRVRAETNEFMNVMRNLEKMRRYHISALTSFPRTPLHPIITNLETPLGSRTHIMALRSIWPTLLNDAREQAKAHPLQHATHQIVSATVYEARVRAYQWTLDEMLAVTGNAPGNNPLETVLDEVIGLWNNSHLSGDRFSSMDRPFYSLYAS